MPGFLDCEQLSAILNRFGSGRQLEGINAVIHAEKLAHSRSIPHCIDAKTRITGAMLKIKSHTTFLQRSKGTSIYIYRYTVYQSFFLETSELIQSDLIWV